MNRWDLGEHVLEKLEGPKR